jgi:hypothetical protein
MWHGSKRWDGNPEVQAPRKGHYEAGPGIYFTTHYMTARKYAKGGGAVMLAEIDRNVRLADTILIPLETVIRFVQGCPRMLHKREIIADLKNNAARHHADSVYAEILINLVVNWEAGAGSVGVAVAKFLREQGVDAVLDHSRSNGENWLVVINPNVVKAIQRVSPKDVSPEMYNLPPVPRAQPIRESRKTDVEAMTWYHGAKTVFDRFDPAHSADGHAQEGPGFYLTSDPRDAAMYGQHIMRLRLKVNKLLPTTGRVKADEVERVMRAAPDLVDVLMNWDENPHRALRAALQSIMRQGDPKSIFEQVWYDFYRDAPAAWLHQMVALGYTGILVPKANGVKHFICYDADALTVL